MTTPRKVKPTRTQAILTVQAKQQLSPSLVRIIAGGPGFAAFDDNAFTDKYVKILFPDPQHGLEPPFDLPTLRAESPEKVPSRRTYTARWVDTANQRLAIDFALHGDHGVAGRWATAAQPGDTLVLTGAGGAYAPDPTVDWHLLVGDLTAVQELEWLPGNPHAFVHGERAAVKALRRHLRDERNIAREQLSISAYWAQGRAEDQFQAEKREPIGAL